MSVAPTHAPRPQASTGAASPAPWALLTGLLFLALAAVSLSSDPAPALDLVFAAGWLSAVVPVVLLRGVHQGRDGRWGTVATWCLVIGAVANALGLGVQVAGSDALLFLALPVGGLLIFVGLVALAIGTWRAGVLPRWCSAAMALVLPLTFLTSIWFPVQGDGSGDYPGVFVVGAFWLALAVATHAGTSARRTTGREK